MDWLVRQLEGQGAQELLQRSSFFIQCPPSVAFQYTIKLATFVLTLVRKPHSHCTAL